METESAPKAAPGLHRVTAVAGDSGERLDRVLASHLGGLSRSRVKHLILDGRVRRGLATISDPSARVKPGEVFLVEIPAPVPDRPAPQPLALDIRYEDDDLIVLDKPAGLVVHPAPGNLDRTLVNALLAHCGDSLSGIGGVKRPGIVHRLDKDTSGLMVVAKTAPAHAGLTAAFAARRVSRLYRAIVWGVPSPRAGEIVGNIGRSPRDRKKMAVLASGGRSAATHYRVLRNYEELAAIVECRLATGRTHQIRVHMSERGHPLIGDKVYGRQVRRRAAGEGSETARARLAAFPRQALHAASLGFEHPTHHHRLEFESDLPKDIAELQDFLDAL